MRSNILALQPDHLPKDVVRSAMHIHGQIWRTNAAPAQIHLGVGNYRLIELDLVETQARCQSRIELDVGTNHPLMRRRFASARTRYSGRRRSAAELLGGSQSRGVGYVLHLATHNEEPA